MLKCCCMRQLPVGLTILEPLLLVCQKDIDLIVAFASCPLMLMMLLAGC